MANDVKAFGTPHQWAYANRLAKSAGVAGVGTFVKQAGVKGDPLPKRASKKAPAKERAKQSAVVQKVFEKNINKMHGVIDALEKLNGITRKANKSLTKTGQDILRGQYLEMKGSSAKKASKKAAKKAAPAPAKKAAKKAPAKKAPAKKAAKKAAKKSSKK